MKEIILKFDSNFQKEIFQKVIKKYNGSINASKYIGIPASSIRGYKNLYFNYVPQKVINRIIKLDVVKIKDIEKNTILSLDKSELINNNLNTGRAKRIQNLKDLKNNIPKIHKIIKNNKIKIYQWFGSYKKLLDSGFRKTRHEIIGEHIVIKYTNYNRKIMKEFVVSIPKEIMLDDEFVYFFGLWCGDRSGGKRLGVCNQNKKILDFTSHFLKQHNQKIEKILYISPNIKEPKIDYNKRYYTKDSINGWCLSVHSSNGIFSSFFHYMQENIEEFFKKINNKNVFFAGLFDAEGNVSLYNKSFRWACQNKKLVNIYRKILKQEGIKNKYDGSSIVCYDKAIFLKKIYPYMKHSSRINKTMLLCHLGGELLVEHKNILEYLKDYPESSHKQIAKALKKNKIYSSLRILKDFDLISQKGYPPKYKQKIKNHKDKKNYNTH